MNALETAIKNALSSEGRTEHANKAYLEFIKANFIVPIERQTDENEEPRVLFFNEGTHIFMPVFTNQTYFDAWAVEIRDNIQVLKLSGVNLLQGIGDQITVSLNLGTPLYKEFNPAELARMRSIINKLGLSKTKD